MTLADRFDDIGRPAWIAVIVLGFVLCWPLGLVVLGYLIGSGRIMGCWTNHPNQDRWQRRMDRWQHGIERMQRGVERMQQRAAQWGGGGPAYAGGPSSGNRAFDEYRADTLRRLEDEQREFLAFLDRLRHAKDKAEFDQFMADRRRPAPETPQY